MAKLRVCIFTETYYPVVGGGESQARALAEGLVADGLDAMVLTRRTSASLKKREPFGKIRVYRLWPTGGGHLRKWGLVFSSLPTLIRLRKQYDVIFVSGFRVIGISAVLISKLLRKACVLKADSLGEMSGDFFVDGLAGLGLRRSALLFRSFLWLRNKILKQADSFVSIASEVASELTTGGVSSEVIQTIPNSVDTTRFGSVSHLEKHQLRRRLGIPLRQKVVIFTGRLVSYKGVSLLLRVWREIQCRHSNVKLLLVGSGGLDIHDCEESLKEYVHANGLTDCVQFTGTVHNVPEYLQASDIFVFPTENEAFGISLIEAMACGLPVISTSVGGVKDILEHRRNGLVITAGDFQQLFNELDMLLTDAALSARLGAAGRKTVEERYSTEIVTKAYVALFRRVSNQPNRSRSIPEEASPRTHHS